MTSRPLTPTGHPTHPAPRWAHIARRAAAAVAVALALPAAAHEMFLRPEQAQAAPNSEQVMRLINGSFDKSENPITRDRMANVSVVAGGAVTRPADSAWSDDATTSYLRWKTGAAGTYVVGVSTRPKVITLSRDDFIKYLKHDGVLDTLPSFEKEALTSVRERYSKHVRAIVQVGEARSADHAKALGYPIEIIPERNPYALKVGDEFAIRVLFKGQPLANQVVRASYEGFHGHDASGGHLNAFTLRTDNDGRAKFRLGTKAAWYISMIHMQRLSEPDVDYESNWATLTFVVR